MPATQWSPWTSGYVGVLTIALFAFISGPASARAEFRVGQIFVVGNEETPQDAILSFLSYKPGEKVSTAKLKRKAMTMRRSGLWSNVRITDLSYPDASMTGYHDVLIQIEERPWNWLLFGVGYRLVLFGSTGNDYHLEEAKKRIGEKFREWVPRLR